MNNIVSKYFIWNPILLCRGIKIKRLLQRFKRTPYLNYDEIKQYQFRKFKDIVTFAFDNIDFYHKKYTQAGVHPNSINSFNDIKKVPILSKNEIMENGDSIYNKRFKGKKYQRSTSGSTGIPFIFYKDAQSLSFMDAILYRNYSWMGIDIGYRQARFWGHPINSIDNLKLMLLDRLLNRVRLSPFQLEEKIYDCYLNKIIRFKAQYVYGYSQSIYQFSNYFYKNEIDLSFLNLKAIILTGEMIFSYQIEIIKSVFNCLAVEEYGCTEIGIIGFGCEFGSIHIMENLLVESDDLSSHEDSKNIIVSELYGNLFPFIRYQVGDRGIIKKGECQCGRNLDILENLSGRKDDFIKCTSGKLIDPYLLEYIINEIPKKYGQIHQFKIIQKKLDQIEILINTTGTFEVIKKFLINRFKTVLSQDMNLSVIYVSHFPIESSGKLRCFVSELEQKNRIHNG